MTLPEGQWVSTNNINGEDLLYSYSNWNVDAFHGPASQEVRRLKPDGTNELLVTLGSTEAPGDTANIIAGAGYVILNATTTWLVE